MKILLLAVVLFMTALLTCSDTSARVETKETIGYSNECYVSKEPADQTSISVKDIPPVGCTLPLGQLESMMEATQQQAKH